MYQPPRGALQLGREKCRHCNSEDTVAHFIHALLARETEELISKNDLIGELEF